MNRCLTKCAGSPFGREVNSHCFDRLLSFISSLPCCLDAISSRNPDTFHGGRNMFRSNTRPSMPCRAEKSSQPKIELITRDSARMLQKPSEDIGHVTSSQSFPDRSGKTVTRQSPSGFISCRSGRHRNKDKSCTLPKPSSTDRDQWNFAVNRTIWRSAPDPFFTSRSHQVKPFGRCCSGPLTMKQLGEKFPRP